MQRDIRSVQTLTLRVRISLFANAKIAKNHVQQLIHIDTAHDFAQTTHCKPHVLSGQHHVA